MTRLIDADAIEYSPLDDIYNNDVMVALKESIENMPTVDAEPVRHGKWFYRDDDLDFYDTYTCSECHEEITVDSERRYDIGFVIEDMKYCPHCGSRNVVKTWSVPDWRKKDDER